MTALAPAGGYHNDAPIWYAGGTVGDSRKGARQAKKQGKRRVDRNGQVSKDGHPVNGHGWPWKPKFLGKRGFAYYRLSTLKLRIPGLLDAQAAFKACRNHDVDVVEWEVKAFDAKHTTPEALDLYMERLKAAAVAVWGDSWHKHLVVKVLTNLNPGGEISSMKYAIRVLKASHKAGIPNMILCRGHWATVVVNRPYITWNRGGKVK